MLTKLERVNYIKGRQSYATGGRFPFRSENSANNRIALNSGDNIALFKVLDGGRSPISRGMGASTSCDVSIPATFFSRQKRGELNNWRLIMSNTQSLSIQTFQHSQFGNLGLIRVDGQEWFKLIDVCKSLDIKNPTDVSKRLDDDELTRFNLGRQGLTWFVNESGLYAVILRSDKPNAKPFRKWVTSEVLPSIRKTGEYKAPKQTRSPRRPPLTQGSDFRTKGDGIYYYEPMGQYGRVPVGIMHGINSKAFTFVTEETIKEALRRRIKMCEKKLASEFWLKMKGVSVKIHDVTGEQLYRLLDVDNEFYVGDLETAMSEIFRKYWE